MAPPSHRSKNGKENAKKMKEPVEKLLIAAIEEKERLALELLDERRQKKEMNDMILKFQASIEECEKLNSDLKRKIEEISKVLKDTEQKLADEIDAHRVTSNSLRTKAENLTFKEHEYENLSISLQNKLNEMKLKSPARFQSLKNYGSIVCQKTKDERCARMVDEMERFVGSENVDKFATDLVSFIARSSRFQFSTKLSTDESFYLALRFKFSDGVMMGLKQFINKKLGFDILASQNSIVALRKTYDPRKDYKIIVSKLRKLVCGRYFEVETSSVVCTNVVGLLRKRLECLDSFSNLVFDIGTGDDIVIAVTADKGADITKMCLVIENCSQPNSAHSLLLLGWYTGNDDHQSLKENFGTVFQQLNDLKIIEFNKEGKLVTLRIRMKLVGDCKLLSAIYHHPGQACLEACYVCDVVIVKSGKNRDTIQSFDLGSLGEIRTLEGMRKKGYEPLLNVEPAMSEPPPLHIYMGLVKTYVMEPLFAMCNKLDFPHGELPETLREQKEYSKLLSKEILKDEKILVGYEETLGIVEEMKEVYERMTVRTQNHLKSHSACFSSHCCIDFVSEKLQDTPLFLCSKCSNRFHTICCEIYSPEESFKALYDPTTCSDCKDSKMTTLPERKEKTEIILNNFESLKFFQSEHVNKLKKEQEELDEKLRKSDGKLRQELEKVMVSIGCDPRAHYQQLTGNQTKNLLKPENVEKLLGIFPCTVDVSGMRRVMLDLCEGMSSSNNAVKTKDDIKKMKNNMDSLKINLKLQHPTLSVLPKLHIYLAHLVPFLETNNTWGRVSEQGMEAFHHFFNQLLVRYGSIRNTEFQALLMVQHIINVNMMTDKGKNWARK
ncbi:unnamed protein product [Caenorhabditis nigoni]